MESGIIDESRNIFLSFFFNKFFSFKNFFFTTTQKYVIKSNNKKNNYMNQLLRLPLLKYAHTEKKYTC